MQKNDTTTAEAAAVASTTAAALAHALRDFIKLSVYVENEKEETEIVTSLEYSTLLSSYS